MPTKDLAIGIDIDGVLANFVYAYQDLVVKLTGKDLFHPGDREDPPCWNWPEFRGYTKEEIGCVWIAIKEDRKFWYCLKPHEENVRAMHQFAMSRLEPTLRTYFITSRPGREVQEQTFQWLAEHTGWHNDPLIVGHRVKGITAKALELDFYIDDNADNVLDVLRDSPKTKTYMLRRRYNDYAVNDVIDGVEVETLHGKIRSAGTCVHSLKEFLDAVEAVG